MKLINLDLDDLYILSKSTPAVALNGMRADLLSMDLGTPIYSGLRNTINFGGVHGWTASEQSELSENRFGMQLGFGAPTIWNHGAKGKGPNLLFSGVYSKDCTSLIAQTHLRVRDYGLLNRVKLIAGGYKSLESGEVWINLVLLVPPELQYVIDNTTYSCKSGGKAVDQFVHEVNLDHVFRNAVVL
jgi:hypothetical protein